jgi:hypothetical protein
MLPRLSFPAEPCPRPKLAQPMETFRNLHIEDDALFLLNVGDRSATEAGA